MSIPKYWAKQIPHDVARRAQVVFVTDHESAILEKNARIATLEAALRTEIAAIQYIDRGSTHWEGCHHEHHRCAAARRMEAALGSSAETPVRRAPSKSEYKRLTTLGVECTPPETGTEPNMSPSRTTFKGIPIETATQDREGEP